MAMPPATGIARLQHARSTRRDRPSGRLSTDLRGGVSHFEFPVGTGLADFLQQKSPGSGRDAPYLRLRRLPSRMLRSSCVFSVLN
jgi:hypothetical protein